MTTIDQMKPPEKASSGDTCEKCKFFKPDDTIAPSMEGIGYCMYNPPVYIGGGYSTFTWGQALTRAWLFCNFFKSSQPPQDTYDR